MTCAHGYIGACAVCDGSGQDPHAEMRANITRHTKSKKKAHYHEYVPHPNPSWSTHYCCRICGFAIVKSAIDGKHDHLIVEAVTTGGGGA